MTGGSSQQKLSELVLSNRSEGGLAEESLYCVRGEQACLRAS